MSSVALLALALRAGRGAGRCSGVPLMVFVVSAVRQPPLRLQARPGLARLDTTRPGWDVVERGIVRVAFLLHLRFIS